MSSRRSAVEIARGRTRNLKSPDGVPDGSAIRRETKKVTAKRRIALPVFLQDLAALFDECFHDRVVDLASRRIRGNFIRCGSKTLVPLSSFLAKHRKLHEVRERQGLPHSIGGLETDLSDGQGGSENFAHRIR